MSKSLTSPFSPASRHNPVLMFLHEGTSPRPGTKTVFSIAGPSLGGAEALAAGTAGSSSSTESPSSTSGSPAKKRSRPPPVLFRLPTEEEERLPRPQALPSSSDVVMVVSTPSKLLPVISPISPSVSTKHRFSESKPAVSSSVGRLLYYATRKPLPRSGTDSSQDHSPHVPKQTTSAEIEKCLRWIRNTAPDLFWTGLSKAKQDPLDWVKCLEVVHNASTTTAHKFVTLIEKSIKPEDHILNGWRVIESIPFLCRTLSGVLLASEKQRDIQNGTINTVLEQFYIYGLRSVMKCKESAMISPNAMDVDPLETEACVLCHESSCVCQKIATLFYEANVALQGLGMMDELAGPVLYSVIKADMRQKVVGLGTDDIDESHTDELLSWLHTRIAGWIETIYPHLQREESKVEIKRMEDDFKFMMLEVCGKAIIKELFSIIIEFPESQPMLDDLKTCMKEVHLRNELVSSLKSALERRLLNAGVNTSDVLEAYVATVRALKYIDPSGILVQLVTPPVREYLKHREETVRVILVSLTEESGELSEELARNPTNLDKQNKVTMANWETWEPDPIDVPKDKHNLRKSDLIEALVSIYGSKTVFIDEYRALLADRLLKLPKPGAITREIKCLELLKLRFGESDLQKCEVMLKDVADSQRLNTRFYEEDGAVLANEDVHVTGLIVSAQFWPTFKQEELELPPPVAAALEKYTKSFEMIKGNRTLEWQKHIGTVELEIEHDGNLLNLTVSPVQATIIYHFQEKSKWSLEELATVTGTPASLLNNRIGFWISKGIIIQVGHGVFALADSIGEGSHATGVIPSHIEETDSDSPMASTSSQRATELQMFWSYIEAMLTNLESLPLPRIHSMLKLFATVECSSEELQKFLDEKVSQNLLVYSAGQYQLPK